MSILIGIKAMLFSFYIGANVGLFMFFPFIIGLDDEDESIKLKHIIINILFPLTILDYVLGFIIEHIIKFIFSKEYILNKTIIKSK